METPPLHPRLRTSTLQLHDTRQTVLLALVLTTLAVDRDDLPILGRSCSGGVSERPPHRLDIRWSPSASRQFRRPDFRKQRRPEFRDTMGARGSGLDDVDLVRPTPRLERAPCHDFPRTRPAPGRPPGPPSREPVRVQGSGTSCGLNLDVRWVSPRGPARRGVVKRVPSWRSLFCTAASQPLRRRQGRRPPPGTQQSLSKPDPNVCQGMLCSWVQVCALRTERGVKVLPRTNVLSPA